jgi:hypothetical protein
VVPIEKLMEFFNRAKDWERMSTPVPSIFIMKLPSQFQWGSGQTEGLVVEINPTNEKGEPIKSRGVIIRDVNELERYKEMVLDKATTYAMKQYRQFFINEEILRTITELLNEITSAGLQVKPLR